MATVGDKQKLPIRPYARLLTMLGEQLIKNERIALIELIKNAYDADSKWVKVSFENFDSSYKITEESKIIIEDSGHGMSREIITKHWLNPATPEKKIRKNIRETTEKGRVIQGEKGIGRFSILKLGRNIAITTRNKSEAVEHVIEYDFSIYDDDFLSENGKEKELYIDDISVSLSSRPPINFIERNVTIGTKEVKFPPHGTKIEISNLKGSWSEKKVESVFDDITRLESIFSDRNYIDKKDDEKLFEVSIYKNNEHLKFREKYLEKLHNLLENNSVFRIEEGFFDSENLEFRFNINDEPKILRILDPEVTGLRVFKERFGKGGEELSRRQIECGSFKFGFYIFDFSSQAPVKYQLDKEDKEIVRNNRIYLYRDNIRVYPYGEPDDDWLGIDVWRGTISAASFLSNDQVVGYVNITQKNNPKLKDKTNREGLIDDGNATDDFIQIIKTFLAYIRSKPYARYRKDIETKKDHDIFNTNSIENKLNDLKQAVGDNKEAQELINKTESEYKTERKYLTRRAETTEDLAGVGLSVETASHDIMGIMGKVFSNLDGIIQDLILTESINRDILLKDLQTIRGGMSFIEAQLKDIQLLFKSSKQRRKQIRIKDVIEKVERIYSRLLKKEKISFLVTSIGSPLVAKTTDAVLLQLLLNLLDNSVYWLQQINKQDKKIEVTLDGNKGEMIFSDNGPGIKKEDIPYIFEPFYSGKGEEGRGLGLYIARQLLERNDYSIELSELKSEKILSGANFIISFVQEDK